MRAVANIKQFRGHVGAFAIFGESHGHGIPTRQTHGRNPFAIFLAHLPQFREIGIPWRTRTLCAVEYFSIRGKFQDLYVAQSVSAGAFGDKFRGVVESARTAHAME